MTRLQKRRQSGYEIGNDHAIDVYENIIRKIPELSEIHFAIVEDLYRIWSETLGNEWVPTTEENVQRFGAWTQEEVR